MDETTENTAANAGEDVGPTGTAASTPRAGALSLPLPFDDEMDAPVGFALTARARRVVAPATLPALSVVRTATSRPGLVAGTPSGPVGDGASSDGPDELADDPRDLRPARARALRRAGLDPATIATRLGVDEAMARRWVADVVVRLRRRPPRRRPVPGHAHPSDRADTLFGPVVGDVAILPSGTDG